MRVLLTTLNAKYIHSSLALRYLEKCCQDRGHEVMVDNDRLDQIVVKKEIFQDGSWSVSKESKSLYFLPVLF